MKFTYGIDLYSEVKIPSGRYFDIDSLSWFDWLADGPAIVIRVNGPVATIRLGEQGHQRAIQVASITLVSID